MLTEACIYVQTRHILYFFFFFNDTATTEIYTLSLHDALPISSAPSSRSSSSSDFSSASISSSLVGFCGWAMTSGAFGSMRSEEHTSELQSRLHLVCRLLLEKKKQSQTIQQRFLSPNFRLTTEY